MNPNQLENADKHASAGKEPSNQGHLKMPAEDYAQSVESSLLEDANRRMATAVDYVRANFRKKHNPSKHNHYNHLCQIAAVLAFLKHPRN